MKQLSLILVIASVFSFSFIKDASAFYVAAGGGLRKDMSGFEGRNVRYPVHFELGGDFFAFLTSWSLQNNVHVIAVRPRIQYLFGPFAGFSIGPGVGASVQYTDADAGTVTSRSVQVGTNLSAHIRYEIIPMFGIRIVPVMVDLNFYEGGGKVDTTTGEAGGGIGDKFSTTYSAMLMLEFLL
jgi:hypothetical protein